MLINLLKKPVWATLLYSLLITLTLMLADVIYGISNTNFAFQFTQKEFIYKLLLFVLIVSILPKKRHRIFIFLLVVISSFIQYTQFEYFGKNINAIDFYLMLTNVHEVFEAFSTMTNLIFIPLLITISAFFILMAIDQKISPFSYKYKNALTILLVLLLILNIQVFYVTNIKAGKLNHSSSKLIYPTTNRHSSRNFFTSINYFIFGIIPKKYFNNKAAFPLLKKPKLINNKANRTIILVIGESLRYDTFSLDDNPLTPKLQTLKNDKDFLFKKVYSGGTMTKVSVSTLINRLKYPGGLTQVSQENNCLFKLAKENKFNTYFLSGQNSQHLQIIRDMMCPKYIDKIVDRNDFEHYMKPTGYDEDIQTLLEKLNILNHSKNLIVLQQRGSHTPYEKQFPKDFDKYSAYENTALYTDSSLYNLINSIKKNTKGETFLFYVSDHGELLGENGKNGHGHLTKEVYEVPFIMVTNTQDKALKSQFNNIKNHYDISNAIIALLGYEADLPTERDRELYILNADLDGFSGYGVINIKNNIESKIELKKY